MRDGVGASGGVEALLLQALDLPPLEPISPSYSVGLMGRLTQGLRRVVQDHRAIAKI